MGESLPGDSSRAPTPWALLAAVIATVSIFAIAQGLGYPLLSFILERQGASAALIGFNAAMTPLGLIVASPLIPWMVRRIGAGPLAMTCAMVAAASLALIGWTQDVVAWFPLRFAIGFAIAPLFVLSETWILSLAPAHRRGRIIGIYTAVISAGFAAGPLALTVVGSEGWPPFLVGIGAFLACALMISFNMPRLPAIGVDSGEASIASFVHLAPTLLLAVFMTAAFEQALFSLLPVYGLSYGVGDVGISALLSMLVAGNIVLQVPLGLAAERWSARRVMMVCALLTPLGCLGLPLFIGTPVIWPLAFVWGAASFAVYTLALIELGSRFSGSMLMAGNAAFALAWGVGGIAGPPVTGATMDLAGIQGLPIALAAMYLVLALARWMRG